MKLSTSRLSFFRHCRPKCLLPYWRYFSTTQVQLQRSKQQQMAEIPRLDDAGHQFYNYTSGRWLYNEQKRRAERRLVFDVNALLQIIVTAVQKPAESISKFTKLAEGGSYRVFEAVLDDGYSVIARLPYPCTLPQAFGIANEVATMRFLRLRGLPVPQVFDWSTSATNAVGSAYIIMAKAEGRELEQIWHTMTLQERLTLMEKIVEVERKLFQIQFPASGSLYETSFLDSQKHVAKMPIDTPGVNAGNFCVGPSAEFLWWYNGRGELAIDRGPWARSEDLMKSVGKRELAWLEKFGNSRHPREPLYRAFYGYQEVDPKVQMQNLRDYLTVVPLVVPESDELNKHTIRHPDLSPSNIFISETGDITGLIDWQHTSILPLFLQAKIPKHIQNWGDDDSENLRPPKLAENFDDLTPSEKEAELETYRRRQTHYFYVGYTKRKNEAHFHAIGSANLVMTNKLYDTAARPWEGDNASLKAEIIRASQHWPDMASSEQAKNSPFPVHYTEEEIQQCLEIDEKQQEADAQMQTLRDCFPVNIDGWVSSELYDQAKARADDVREQMLEAADTADERKEIEENWPFQDHVDID